MQSQTPLLSAGVSVVVEGVLADAGAAPLDKVSPEDDTAKCRSAWLPEPTAGG